MAKCAITASNEKMTKAVTDWVTPDAIEKAQQRERPTAIEAVVPVSAAIPSTAVHKKVYGGGGLVRVGRLR